MSHVFISYSRKDSETVDQIAARLGADGFNIWLDREAIKGGELWRERIVGAVDHAYACVLMLSPSSAASDNVRKEVDLSEGANKKIVPVMLAPVELPAKLRYQLAGIQWIEYYRDPEVKYAELIEVLRARLPKQPATKTQREVEIVIKGLNLSKFGPEEQEKLLTAIAEVIGLPRTDLKVTAIKAGSVHVFIDMPADGAYRLKTAALNREARLINHGVDALRLTGDRYFVFPKTGQFGPLNPRKPGKGWFTGTLALMIALFLSVVIIAVAFSLGSPLMSSFFPTAVPSATHTSTATNTFTSTPSYTVTATETPTSTPSQTPTPTNTFTPTKTPTSTPSQTATPTRTFTPSPTATHTPSSTPNLSSTFFDPIVSTSHFGCGAVMSKVVTVQEIVVDPSGVSAVDIYFWLINKTTPERRYESSLPMTFVPAGLFSHWKRDISLPDIQDYPPQDYWFQFSFIATDNAGVQSQSLTYGDLVTFTSCIVPPA